MADLTLQAMSEAGVAVTLATAAAGGDQFSNDGRTELRVKNGGGSPITVTITAQRTTAKKSGMGTLNKANGGGSVAAGAEKTFGPFPVAAFNDTNNKVQVTYSAVTSVTAGAIQMPAE